MTQSKGFELDRRQAMLMNVNLRSEKHGEDDVPAVDIKLEGITLAKEELNILLDDKHAHDAMFATGKKGTIIEPMFKQFAPFVFKEKYEGCSAMLCFGLNEDGYELEDLKFKGITLEPLPGGMTAMSLTIQHELDDTEIVSQLADYLQRECSVQLTFGAKAVAEKKAKDKQGKLPLNEGTDKPLNTHGEGEAPAATH